MADSIRAEAVWQGGLSAVASARGHEVLTDEPVGVGGSDLGMMPTELFCASLASCFCLAVGHVAGKGEVAVPGLRVTVDAEREGSELRYRRLRIEVAAMTAEAELADLVQRAKRFCWVSNMLAADLEVSYVPVALEATDAR